MHKARKWASVLVAVGTLALTVGAQSCGPDATSNNILADTNNARAQVGLPGLVWNGQLGCLATAWSQWMASTNNFFHRDLGSVINSPGYGGYHPSGRTS